MDAGLQVVTLALQLLAAAAGLRMAWQTRRIPWLCFSAATFLFAAERLAWLSHPSSAVPEAAGWIMVMAAVLLCAGTLGIVGWSSAYDAARNTATQAIEALRLSEARKSEVLNCAMDCIITIDHEGKILEFNPAAEKTFGYRRSDVLGLAVADLIIPEAQRRLHSDGMARYLQTGLSQIIGTKIEVTALRSDGKEIPVELRVHPEDVDRPPRFTAYIRDLTERKQAEAELRRGDEQIRMMLRNINDIVYSWEIDSQSQSTRTQIVSDQVKSILGYEPAQFFPYPDLWFRLIHPDDVPIILESQATLFRDMSTVVRLYRVRHRHTGQWRWLEDKVVPQIGENGQVVRLFGVARDITERKRMSDELRESEERFQELAANIHEVFWMTSADLAKLLYVSPVYESIWGRSCNSMYANPWSRYAAVHAEDRERVRAAAVGKQTLGTYDEQYRIVRPDGSVRWIRDRAFPIRNEYREIYRIAGVAEDITEEKLAEARQERLQADIEKSAREWTVTFDAVQSPIVVLDSEGRIQRMNRFLTELTGLRFSELLGMELSTAGRGQPWRQGAELARRIGAGEPAASCQVCDEESGRTWDIAASLYRGPRDGEGRIVLIMRDITSVVRLQESLRRSETLSAMGNMLAAVAHEVRNPLFGISATLDAFGETFKMEAAFQPFFEVLRGELTRLNKLMHELLDYGKPLLLKIGPLSLKQTVVKAIQLCSPSARLLGVEVCCSSLSDDLPFVLGDDDRLIQVFQNLLENAIQHSTAGSTILVEAEAASEPDALAVICRVSDSGPGFPTEDLSRVFEPFFSRRRGGVGLGLSIVQRIVVEHGGTIVAANRPEGGATLTLKLPGVRVPADKSLAASH